jgi:hypothetical protein
MTISDIFWCKYCNEYLCIDNNIVSGNGKPIPLNGTGENRRKPHNCSVNPFKKFSYDLRQLPQGRYPEEGKVRRCDKVYGPNTRYDTSEGIFYHTNKYEW